MPLPTPDRDTAEYWRALADGRLLLQRCTRCSHWTWPARPICSNCHGGDLTWTESPGAGEVYSWVVTHQSYGTDLAELVPYPVALVRLDEQDDLLIPGRYVGVAELVQGLRVHAQTEVATEDIGLLAWVDDDAAHSSDHPGFVWVLNCPCGDRLRGGSEDHIVEVAQAHLAEKHPDLTYDRRQIMFMSERFRR